MKKLFLSVAIIAAAAISFSATAQQPEVVEVEEATETVTLTPDNATPAQRISDRVKGAKAKMTGKKECKKGHGQKCTKGENGNVRGEGRQGKPCMFEGLNLTPEQQTALEALKPACKGGNEAKCEKAEGKCDKADGKKCDKADGKKCDKADGKMCDKGNRPSVEERKAQKSEFLSKVKEILTPEQYTQFLENNFHSPRH